MFAKKDNKQKNVKASTHLLCPLGEGQKYAAAVKWGLPVVSKVRVQISGLLIYRDPRIHFVRKQKQIQFKIEKWYNFLLRTNKAVFVHKNIRLFILNILKFFYF